MSSLVNSWQNSVVLFESENVCIVLEDSSTLMRMEGDVCLENMDSTGTLNKIQGDIGFRKQGLD